MTEIDFFRHRIAAAYTAGFPLLRRIPSVFNWRQLSFIDSLSEVERCDAFDLLARQAREQTRLGLGLITVEEFIHDKSIHTEQLKALKEAKQSYRGWQCFPDRFMRQFSANVDALAEMVDESRIESICSAEPPVIAKAAAIRKFLKKAMADSFEAKAINRGAGEWQYVGVVNDSVFSLECDFGGMGSGFTYYVQFVEPHNPIAPISRITYESTSANGALPGSICQTPSQPGTGAAANRRIARAQENVGAQ